MIIWKKQPKLDATFKDFNSIKSMDKMNEEVKNSDYVRCNINLTERLYSIQNYIMLQMRLILRITIKIVG